MPSGQLLLWLCRPQKGRPHHWQCEPCEDNDDDDDDGDDDGDVDGDGDDEDGGEDNDDGDGDFLLPCVCTDPSGLQWVASCEFAAASLSKVLLICTCHLLIFCSFDLDLSSLSYKS